MRTFIAIELPKEIKDFLNRIQEQLKTSGAEVKWVEPKNIHLTLKFLGEIDNEKQNKITEIIEDVASAKKSFLLRLSSLGAFPKIDFPKVIWLGIDQGDKETKEIAKELEEKINKLGIPKEERPFSSHITIGRTRSSKNREKLVLALKTLGNNFGGKNLEFLVNKVVLFKSTLTPAGPIYEILREIDLKTT